MPSLQQHVHLLNTWQELCTARPHPCSNRPAAVPPADSRVASRMPSLQHLHLLNPWQELHNTPTPPTHVLTDNYNCPPTVYNATH
jgi:hypothetical protein